MKKMITFLCFCLYTFLVSAQTPITTDPTIVYGDYSGVETGAFWHLYPEAEKVHKGQAGGLEHIQVRTLKEDYFAKFVKGEHSPENSNYVRLSPGTVVYKNTLDNSVHVARCGNTCYYLHPVKRIEIQQLAESKDSTVRVTPALESAVSEEVAASSTKKKRKQKKKYTSQKPKVKQKPQEELPQDCGCETVLDTSLICAHEHTHCFVDDRCSVPLRCGKGCLACYPVVEVMNHVYSRSQNPQDCFDCDDQVNWARFILWVLIVGGVLFVLYILKRFIFGGRQDKEDPRSMHIHADIHVGPKPGADYTQS